MTPITIRQMKLRALWETFKIAPSIISKELLIIYHKFLNGMLDAYIKNPTIKWK